MKNLFSLCMAMGSSLFISAQTPTFNFEIWSGSGPTGQPSGWLTGNGLTTLGNPQSTFKITDAHSGQYAMKIVTVKLTNNSDPSHIPNPYGGAITGKLTPSYTFISGFPYISHPATAEFWYKYIPMAGDAAGFFIILTHWNGTSQDTIAAGYWQSPTAQTSYTFSQVSLVYNPAFSNTIPDSATIGFSATRIGCLTCGIVGSTLWVDDVTFSGLNAINEQSSSNSVILFPNPAMDVINMSVNTEEAYSIEVYDITGRKLASEIFAEPENGFNKKTGIIHTPCFADGLYSYTIFDRNKNILNSGKFSVVQ